MSRAIKQRYLEALDAADAWAAGAPVVTRPLAPYMTGIPRDKMFDRVDREFWVGEVMDNIRFVFEKDPLLTAQEKSELDAVLEMHIDRRIGERVRRQMRGNPSGGALTMYRRFHSQEPRKVGTFHRDLVIPEEMCEVGDAVHVLYRSDKLNPTTGEDEGWIDYIHEHERGVRVFLPVTQTGDDDGPVRAVPVKFRRVTELTWLGDCLGFEFRDHDGKKVKAKGTRPLPELYTVPSGRALLVVQGKRRLLAMIWGGKLGVEHRGIVH